MSVLKSLRKNEDLTQYEIAEMLGINRTYYSLIETGSLTPGLQLAKQIADLFNTTVDNIFFSNTYNETLGN